MIADFEDREEGGFFFTAEGHESLLARPKDPFDNALPSGNSMAILDLLALHRATGESSYRDHAGKALGAFSTTDVPARLRDAADARGPGAVPRPGARTRARAGRRSPRHPTREARRGHRLGRGASGADRPRRRVRRRVSLTIQDGWHIYANPTGVPELKPTTLDLDPDLRAVATLVKVTYPAGEAKVLGSIGTEKVPLYEGKVQFDRPAPARRRRQARARSD